MKKHLTSAGKKGPRCPGLRVVILKDVWDERILLHYTSDAPLPDLAEFVKKSPGPKRKSISTINDRRSKKRRLSNDGELSGAGHVRLSQDELLELLHHSGDNDMRWLINKIRNVGCTELRKVYTIAKKSKPPEQFTDLEALALQAQLFLSKRSYF